MAKNSAFRITAILIALAGVVILWQSTVWGLRAATGVITALGSVSGEIEHQIVYEGPVTTLRIIGALLLGIGLFRALEPSKSPESSR
jgi:uncharacterized protein YjeT (DUF2065 family)